MSTSQNNWKSLGGKTRRFINTKTGEVLSRRQYEQKILGRGASFFEKKAQASKLANEKLAAARPARGRKSTVSEYKTGISKSELSSELAKYRIKTAVDKKRYATWNTSKNVWGFTTIHIKHPRIKGVAQDGDQAAADEEAETLPAVVAGIVEAIKGMKGISGWQVQIFAMHDGDLRPMRDWSHELQHKSSELDISQLHTLLEQGQVDGSAAGAAATITVRAYFAREQAAKHYTKEKPRMEAARARKIAQAKKKIKAQKKS